MDLTVLEANSAKASQLLRVLSNEKRLMILCNLLGGERSVQQLQEATGLGQSTVSQQLAVLRGERIVKFRREAQSVFYEFDSPEAAAILQTLHGIYCRT
ncbi:ArsR/SmtB family transcription factor [Marimonas arenosa]|uniref:Metalloregulator ArsR/SmtB family transcription factor n=1 Tax=Marimonas arenosa TaxID=1795305 RepID=A0AAE3WAF4_9RHOB|nr:metalloregulator ArsR/SmtB family transcription factor [Marimonas arenosa]MDQ2089366.1 metalloregulator ArsR/SmtB family transcription factor [Marimonas arenosa]